MKLLDRYFIRELIVPFLIGQAAVVLMLTGTVLYNNADMFLMSHVSASGIARIAFYFLPFLISLTMPVATAIAVSLLVSRLARDSEITVLRAAGISLKRIFFSFMVAGLLLSVVDFWWGETVVPWSNRMYEKTLTDISREAKVLVPQQQQFVQSKDRRTTAYIESLQLLPGKSGASLFNVMIFRRGMGDSLQTVMISPRADYQDGIWTLHNTRVHQFLDGGLTDRYIESAQVRVDFRLEEKTFNGLALQLPFYDQGAMRPLSEIGASLAIQREAAERSRKMGATASPINLYELLQYHFKLSVPFSCLVFALLCPPLALRFAKAGNFMGVLLSIGVVFVYWNILLAARILGGRFPEVIPPYVAAWGQNVVFTVIGLIVLWRSE